MNFRTIVKMLPTNTIKEEIIHFTMEKQKTNS